MSKLPGILPELNPELVERMQAIEDDLQIVLEGHEAGPSAVPRWEGRVQ